MYAKDKKCAWCKHHNWSDTNHYHICTREGNSVKKEFDKSCELFKVREAGGANG